MTASKLDILPSQPNFRHIFTMKTLNSGQDVRVLTLQFLFSYILVLLYYKIRQVKLLRSELHTMQLAMSQRRKEWSAKPEANLQTRYRNCSSLTLTKQNEG